MTTAQQTKRTISRLQAENDVLREANNKHLEVYRERCLELIALRSIVQQMRELAEELNTIDYGGE